jgi:hypothetical protein
MLNYLVAPPVRHWSFLKRPTLALGASPNIRLDRESCACWVACQNACALSNGRLSNLAASSEEEHGGEASPDFLAASRKSSTTNLMGKRSVIWPSRSFVLRMHLLPVCFGA